MILGLRNKTPFITFGFNRVSVDAFTGEEIDVWLNTLYNEVSYPNRVLSAPDAIVTKVNNYHYKLSYNSSGVKTIYLDVQDVPKDITLTSNILSVDIKSYTADTNKLTSDTTLITADYF